MPDDERELIFERFQRGSGRGGEGGFGLGLAIGSELATRMGGALELTDAHARRDLPPDACRRGPRLMALDRRSPSGAARAPAASASTPSSSARAATARCSA